MTGHKDDVGRLHNIQKQFSRGDWLPVEICHLPHPDEFAHILTRPDLSRDSRLRSLLSCLNHNVQGHYGSSHIQGGFLPFPANIRFFAYSLFIHHIACINRTTAEAPMLSAILFVLKGRSISTFCHICFKPILARRKLHWVSMITPCHPVPPSVFHQRPTLYRPVTLPCIV